MIEFLVEEVFVEHTHTQTHAHLSTSSCCLRMDLLDEKNLVAR